MAKSGRPSSLHLALVPYVSLKARASEHRVMGGVQNRSGDVSPCRCSVET